MIAPIPAIPRARTRVTGEPGDFVGVGIVVAGIVVAIVTGVVTTGTVVVGVGITSRVVDSSTLSMKPSATDSVLPYIPTDVIISLLRVWSSWAKLT